MLGPLVGSLGAVSPVEISHGMLILDIGLLVPSAILLRDASGSVAVGSASLGLVDLSCWRWSTSPFEEAKVGRFDRWSRSA